MEKIEGYRWKGNLTTFAILLAFGLVVLIGMLSCGSQSPSAKPAEPAVPYSPSEGPPQGLQQKMQTLQESLQRWQKEGRDLSPVGKVMQEFEPLMKAGKVKEAEAKLDEALALLRETPGKASGVEAETTQRSSSSEQEKDLRIQIQEKMQQIQELIPDWQKSGGDPSTIQPLFEEFSHLDKAGKPEEALKKLDEVLALLKSPDSAKEIETKKDPIQAGDNQKSKRPADIGKGGSKPSSALYLLFQIFTGGPEPKSGIFSSPRKKNDYKKIVQELKSAVNVKNPSPDRKLGFSVGPLAMDQSDEEIRRIIRDSFDIALDQDLAVAFHLDDYMFWKNADGKNGKKLVDNLQNKEWKDWKGTASDPLKIGWLPNVNLAPQMCYESLEVKDAVSRFAKEVVGREVKIGVEKLKQFGKEDLFAGVIVGWESNLADGYCSLTQKGFSAKNPPKDFDLERETIMHDHIERWAKGVYDAGINKESIYTHVAIISRKDYEKMKELPVEKFRQIPQSTNVRAFWTAFNKYANPGFSAYAAGDVLDDIHDALAKNGNPPWALSEGTNVALTAAGGSTMNWETYLAKMFNYGARIANIFGGWQGEAGIFERATQSGEAIAAYKKFLIGETLQESKFVEVKEAGKDNPADLRSLIETRMKSIRDKIPQYQKKGGDMQKLQNEMESLHQHMTKGQIEEIKKSLATLEEIVK